MPLKSRLFRFNSIGTKLFVSMLGGSLVAIGGVAWLFGETVKYQSENQIRIALDDKVQVLDSHLGQVERIANTLRTSVLALHQQEATSAETYRRLLFELIKDRPDGIVGVGISQSEKGLLPQSWFSAYYSLDSGQADAPGQPLSAPYEDIRYLDGTQPDVFYPDSDRYRNYIQSRQAVWSPPESSGASLTTTYYSPLLAEQDSWLGAVFVEMSGAALGEVINNSVFRDAGYFAVFTPSGALIAAPAAPDTIRAATSYQDIPDLNNLWSQMTQNSGLVEGEMGYWAYERLPQGNLVAIAYLPYGTLFFPVALITVGGVLVAGVLVALVAGLSVRSLTHRLKPMVEECYRLTGNNPDLWEVQRQQDEIGQISTSFFHAIERLKQNEDLIRQEVAQSVQTQEKLKQMAIAEQTNQELQLEVEHLLDIVSAVSTGDLSVEAQVGTGVTGLVADTFNHLVERLGYTMAVIVNATQQVAQGAAQLEKLAITVSSNAQQQTQTVGQVQALMEAVDELSQDAASQANATHDAVQLTQSAAQQGQQEISQILEGIGNLQNSTDQILKRIETLGSYVDLAAQFAKDQKRIASMTRILAVNASMLANRAAIQQDPEQFAAITREFETVATQVNDLATQTNQSLIVLQQRTDQIQTTVSGLDHDVQEIGQQVNDFTLGVAQSRDVFDTIYSASEQVAQTGQQVAQSSQAIANAAQAALRSIQTIFAIASETSGQAELTHHQASQIESLTQELSQAVEFFKLRADQQQAIVNAQSALPQKSTVAH